MENKAYIAIDLKSFYASVECAVRNLDALDTNLIVADESRGDGTICLAVSPSMKAYGLPGRCRLFEVRKKIEEINRKRQSKCQQKKLFSKSTSAQVLTLHPEFELDCIIAPPQMSLYKKISKAINEIYYEFVSPEDLHIYSIDEVFIDATPYLRMYNTTPKELAGKMITRVLEKTKITATAGIGTNLYLAKIAMDIMAKHIEPDAYGVRIAELNEMSYRKYLWNHTPITDFWRIGKGTAARLAKYGIHTMGDLAKISTAPCGTFLSEDTIYKEFGVNAELLIDHAWGYEPCTMKDIKMYKSSSNSMSSGQVLLKPYTYDKAKIIAREMAETLSLDLYAKSLITPRIALYIGYDHTTPGQVNGAIDFIHPTSSTTLFGRAGEYLFEQLANPEKLVRRMSVSAIPVISESKLTKKYIQGELFEETNFIENEVTKMEEKDRKIQQAVLAMKNRFGKNSLIKAMNLQEDAMQIQRNLQIGGHKA